MLAIPFPSIDPVLVSFGPIKVYWYGISYFLGILGGWKYALWLCERYRPDLTVHADRFFIWMFVAVIVGGRLGHVFIYEPDYYLNHPLEILMTWKGGMSFHGGAVAAFICSFIYCRLNHISLLRFGDLVCSCVTIGLFFGRIANFINCELLGRPTDMPWGVMFPNGGYFSRHPTQLYEAFCEGLILFIAMYFLWKKRPFSSFNGRLAGVFFLGYGLLRGIIEFFKEPDLHIGYFLHYFTMGHILCMPMIIAGILLIILAPREEVILQENNRV